MRITCFFALGRLAVTSAAFSGDVVQYWIDQTSIYINSSTSIYVNGTLNGGQQTPTTCWSLAIVSASMYNAAIKTKSQSFEYKQLAVSYAAHNALTWIFHGSRDSPYIDQSLKIIQTQILTSAPKIDLKAVRIAGQIAAYQVISARERNGLLDFVDYNYGPATPGIYQLTVAGYGLAPDGPQIPRTKLFANDKTAANYLAPKPPQISDADYEDYLNYVKSVGFVDSTTRTADETDIALFWRESAPIKWNRIANAMVGTSLIHDIETAAKLYTQLNYAMFNGAVASWVSKFHYNTWRPETALHRTDIWLPSGHNVSQPSFRPLITPTPVEQEYSSGHATVGAAGAAVLRIFNRGNAIDISVSSLVTQTPQHISTRHFTSLAVAAQEIGDSRVFGGIHFKFSTQIGLKIGEQVAADTLEKFDVLWSRF